MRATSPGLKNSKPVTRQRNLLEIEPKIEHALEWTRLRRDCSFSDKLRKAALLYGEGSVHKVPTGNWGMSFLKISSLKFLHFTAVVKKHIIFSPDKFKGLLQAVQEGIIQHTCSLCSLHSKSCPLDSENKKDNNSIILVLTLSITCFLLYLSFSTNFH